MDVITTFIVVTLILFLLFSICGWCCKKKRPEASFISVAVPVVTAIPSQPHGANPPYPVQQTMPLPMNSQQMPALPIGFSGYPQPGHGYPHPAPAAYPPPGTRDFSSTAGYPPYPGYPPQTPAGVQQHPPTYDEATAGGQMYNKQSPYNPNFQ